jgi:uncharacterized protein
MKGLSGVVDGEHYFDTIAENATLEFLYEFPGWPRTIRGRAELMTAYSGYGNSIRLRSADKLVGHHAGNGKVVIIEYEVHGKIQRRGAPYDNRFVSIITVAESKDRSLARLHGLFGCVELPKPAVLLTPPHARLC